MSATCKLTHPFMAQDVLCITLAVSQGNGFMVVCYNLQEHTVPYPVLGRLGGQAINGTVA